METLVCEVGTQTTEIGKEQNRDEETEFENGCPEKYGGILDVEQVTPSNLDRAEKEEQALEVLLPRSLSSPDKFIREKALVALEKWLSSSKQVEESHLINIWQSIFYCIWQSKGPAQVELAKNIAVILGSLTPEIAIFTFKVLLSTILREWNGIEKKKIEKFRSLLQLCLSQIFRVLESHGWDHDLIRKFIDAFGEHSLMVNEDVAQGVHVFLARAFVEELRSFVPPSPEILKMLLEPFLAIFATSRDKLVLQKVRDAVFLPLLQEARGALRNKNSEQDKSLGSLVLGLPLAGRLFELAASPSLNPINKKFLSQLSEDFSKSENFLHGKRKSVSPMEPNGTHNMEPPSASPDAVIYEMTPDKSLPQELSVTGRRRKRINAGAGESSLERRRILRSDQKLLDMAAQHSSDEQCRLSKDDVAEGDPVVLDLQEAKLTTLARLRPRSQPESLKRKLDSSTTDDTSEKEYTSTSSTGDELSEAEHAAKRVRFSLRNNLVWCPQKPIPPQWVRVPPCAAPRGSAMKAGVEPGPICSPPSPSSRKQQRKAKRKAKKSAKSGKKKHSKKSTKRHSG